MSTKFSRAIVVLGTTILIMQIVFIPIGIVYAETITNREEIIEETKDYQEEMKTESSQSTEETISESEVEFEENTEDSTEQEEEIQNSSKEEHHAQEYEETNTRSSVSVSTWEQFRTAINNQSVTTINITANISGNTSLNAINRSLTINGNGFTINTQQQSFLITGEWRRIIATNVTFTSTVTSTTSALFRATSNARYTHFTFRDVNFNGTGRFVDAALAANNQVNDDAISDVVFDGGTNYLNSGEITIAHAEQVLLKNQTTVVVEGYRFLSSLVNSSIDYLNRMGIIVEQGSSLSINARDAGFFANSVEIYGNLSIRSGGAPIASGSRMSQPQRIAIGENARIIAERTSESGSIFSTGVGITLNIAEGAQFDFINQGTGNLFNNRSNLDINIETEYLSLWDRGLQNEDKASIVFSDIALQLNGINGSEIISTNNERFQRLYDSNGLSLFSRMSSQNVDEMDRFIKVHFKSEDGEILTNPVPIKGFLGDLYEAIPKDIEGYELAVIPDNANGVFTREDIDVTYVYAKKTIVSPVDPINPEAEIDPENPPVLPENQGLLSIDFASEFKFGINAISAQDKTYYAQPQRLLNEDGTVNETQERPNFIQISDRRADNERSGWQLSVTQNGQFSNQNGHELIGSEIQLFNQELVTAQGGTMPELQEKPVQRILPNQKKVLLQADKESGTGTWIYRFGDQNTADKSIGLYVPKGTNPEATSYSTTLTWELSSVPNN
ncbi:WxL domain-containing protein [Enterococcus mundtii]